MPGSTTEWTHPLQRGDDIVPMLIDGKWLGGATTSSTPVFDPGSGEEIAQVAAGGADDRPGGRRGPCLLRGGALAGAVRHRPGRRPLARRRPHAGTGRRPRRAGEPQPRPARRTGPRHGARGRGPVPLLRRLGRQDPRTHRGPRHCGEPRPGIHPPRTRRRRRTDHTVERAAEHGGEEAGPRAGGRLLLRPQAGRGDAADVAVARADPARGRRARRRRERGHGCR